VELLILYLGLAFVGYLVGNKLLPKDKNKSYKWVTMIQMVAVTILIFTMGARIGADETIVAGLGSIGLSSAVLTIFTMFGSVLMVFLLRKLLKTDKRGVRQND
jgi:uncharacterized membrane protein YbjE (DUF340 family)